MDVLSNHDARPLAREVLPPRDGLCNSCLGAEKMRRRALAHVAWIFAIVFVLVYLLGAWS